MKDILLVIDGFTRHVTVSNKIWLKGEVYFMLHKKVLSVAYTDEVPPCENNKEYLFKRTGERRHYKGTMMDVFKCESYL